jgi:hypothetical protein
MSSINDLLQNNDAREERKLAKENNRTKKLELKQQMIEEKIRDNAARRQEAMKQQEMMMKLVDTLTKKNKNDNIE